MTTTAPDGYVAPDDRGRFALRKFIDKAIKFYAVRMHKDGTITLTPQDREANHA